MSVPTPKPSALPTLKERLTEFGREHGWLCAGCLIAVIAATAEGRKPEDEVLAGYRRDIAALSADQQKELRIKAVSFNQLSRTEQSVVQSIHQDVVAHPEHAATLTAYHEWLTSLPKERRDAISSIQDPQLWMTAIREERDRHDDSKRPGSGNYAGPFGKQPGGGFGFAGVRKPAFESIMRGLAKHYSLPIEAADKSQLGRWENHIRIVNRIFNDLSGKGSNDNGAQAEVQKVIRESFGREGSEGPLKSDTRMILRMMAFSLINEGVELLLDNDKLRDQFEAEAPPFMRKDIAQLRPDEARRRLAMSHIRSVSPGLEERIRMALPPDEGEGPGPDGRPDGSPDFGPPDGGPRGGRPMPFGPRPGDRGGDDGPRRRPGGPPPRD